LGRNAIVALFALALVMGSAPRADRPQELTAATLSDGHFTFVAPIAVVASCTSLAVARVAWLDSRPAPPGHQERPFDILGGQALPLAQAPRRSRPEPARNPNYTASSRCTRIS